MNSTTITAAQPPKKHSHRGSIGSIGSGASKLSSATTTAVNKAAGEEALIQLESQLRTDFTTAIPFSDLDSALSATVDDYVIICVGTSWSFPCRSTFENLNFACSVDSKIKLFLIDHESFRAFLPELPIGVPAIAQIKAPGGGQITFKGRKFLIGQLSYQNASDLVDILRNRNATDTLDLNLPFDKQ